MFYFCFCELLVAPVLCSGVPHSTLSFTSSKAAACLLTLGDCPSKQFANCIRSRPLMNLGGRPLCWDFVCVKRKRSKFRVFSRMLASSSEPLVRSRGSVRLVSLMAEPPIVEPIGVTDLDFIFSCSSVLMRRLSLGARAPNSLGRMYEPGPGVSTAR